MGKIDGIWEGGVEIGELLGGDLGSLGIFMSRIKAKARNPGENLWDRSNLGVTDCPFPNPNGARAGHPRPDGVTRYKGMFGNLIPKKRPHPAGNFGWIKPPQGLEPLTQSEVGVGWVGKESQKTQNRGFGKIP